MHRRQIRYHVVVDCETCWGRLVGEDSDQESCRLCVDVCPEVFDKPQPNGCARSRPGVDPAPFLACVCQAVRLCPTEAIQLVAVAAAA